MQIVGCIQVALVFVYNVVNEIRTVGIIQIGMKELGVGINQSSGVAIENHRKACGSIQIPTKEGVVSVDVVGG